MCSVGLYRSASGIAEVCATTCPVRNREASGRGRAGGVRPRGQNASAPSASAHRRPVRMRASSCAVIQSSARPVLPSATVPARPAIPSARTTMTSWLPSTTRPHPGREAVREPGAQLSEPSRPRSAGLAAGTVTPHACREPNRSGGGVAKDGEKFVGAVGAGRLPGGYRWRPGPGAGNRSHMLQELEPCSLARGTSLSWANGGTGSRKADANLSTVDENGAYWRHERAAADAVVQPSTTFPQVTP